MKRFQTGRIWLGFLILMLPLNWVGAALLAAVVHELCHFLALVVFRVPVYRLEIGAGGAILETGEMGIREELFCALAGPIGSFALLILARRFPRLALCGLVQGCFNAIPLGKLDGGRTMRCLIAWVRGKKPCKREMFVVLYFSITHAC